MTFSPIQKNIPIPKPKFSGPVFQQLSKLAKDDYFETELESRHALLQYASRYNMKIKTRKMENGNLGVWCIKPYKK